MSSIYRCNHCGGIFTSDWDDEEAKKEFEADFPNCDMSDAVVVCDDCYIEFMNKMESERGTPD